MTTRAPAHSRIASRHAMIVHTVRIAAVTAFIVLCTVLPFLPGRYDSLAVSLSLISLLFGRVGLVLVPVGALWLASEIWSGHPGRRRIVTIAAFLAVSVVWFILSVGALVESLTLAFFALALWAYVAVRLWPRLRLPTSAAPGRIRAAPVYLLIVPAAVAVLQLILADPVAHFSRTRAIRNSAPLIADIERHRAANGHYPLSIVSVNADYKPSVIGVKRYQYESTGHAYNVLFEHPSFELGTVEIVMYNPRGEQVMTSHALDVLQLTPEQLALDRTRGHYAVHDASVPKWKYFLFD